jgi:hypothetical protein
MCDIYALRMWRLWPVLGSNAIQKRVIHTVEIPNFSKLNVRYSIDAHKLFTIYAFPV